MDPNFGLAHNHLAQAYLQKQMNDEAVAELQQAVQLLGVARHASRIANLARAYVASGNKSEAEKLLSDLNKRSNPKPFACLRDCCDLCSFGEYGSSNYTA